MLEPTIKKNFLDLFYHEIQEHVLDRAQKSTLNLFILKISNNKFNYEDLVQELFDCVISYALSRAEIDKLKDSQGGKKFKKAVSKFRVHNSNEGELGEILLYCFLESHLNAPKIFTKMELKTNSNDYVKGSDGVHLLKLNETNYQLIFGQSKMESKLTEGISEALKSVHDFVNREKNNIEDEIRLLDTHLQKEAVSDPLYDFLKKIIVPSAKDSPLNRDNAFGIFLGFDLNITDAEKNLGNAEFRTFVRERIKIEVENKIEHVKEKIRHYKLTPYSFYVYILPFTNLEETRKGLVKDLTE